MTDFDSSYDSGEETNGGDEFDSGDSGTEIDINSDEGAYIDVSGEKDGDVAMPTETEGVTEINISGETNSSVSIGDSNIGNGGKDNVGDSNADKPGEVKTDESGVGKTGEVNIDETDDAVKADEENTLKSTEVDEAEDSTDKVDVDELDDEELQEYLEKESPYSPEVNEYISSPEELQVYKEAGLVEKSVDGRICLVREDLDLNYVDKQSGLTNAELIAKGRSPYDAKTGERIELHHIGQDFNAPLAELQSVSEHDVHSKTLHKSETDSWRRDPEKVSQYNAQRKAHWKSRV